MNATQTVSNKWSFKDMIDSVSKNKKLVTYGVLSVLGIHALLIGSLEGNVMAFVGLLPCILAAACVSYVEDKKKQRKELYQTLRIGIPGLKRGEYWYLHVLIVLAIVTSFVLPLDHEASRVQVWFLNGQTTLTHQRLIRTPFGPLATSVNVTQNHSVNVIVQAADGQYVTAHLSGQFSTTDNEEVLRNGLGMKDDPDAYLGTALQDVLRNAFTKALAGRTIDDLGKLPTTFALEFDTGSLAEVRQLGVKRNGLILVKDIHPYFVDRSK